MRYLTLSALFLGLAAAAPLTAGDDTKKGDDKGWVQLFNGKDLTGWKGLPLKSTADDKKKSSRQYRPMTMPERLKASPEELAEAQKRGDESAHEHRKIEDGVIVFDGKGVVSDANKPGFLFRLIQWITPF